MSKEEREFLDALRSHSIEATAEILDGVQRLKSLYEEMNDDGTGAPLQPPKLRESLFHLARVELEHAVTLVRLGNAQADMVFDHVRKLARRGRQSAAPVIELVPGPDNVCTARFEVRNPFDRPADLRYEIAKLSDATGEAVEHRLTLNARTGRTSLLPSDTAWIELRSDPPRQVLFGSITVFAVADHERPIARRVIKVRPDQA